ncbi:mandelate racemase, partial [Paenibacillus sepulcri]|nr:mandelate racemase [Paenibacillus sepulcri]
MAKITQVKCIRTRHDGSWTIVKVLTDQEGLYGIGSASDMYNPEAVVQIVEQLLGPLLVGRDASRIEDIWQTMYTSGYWRNGSTLQTAIGSIDMALWDIKG